MYSHPSYDLSKDLTHFEDSNSKEDTPFQQNAKTSKLMDALVQTPPQQKSVCVYVYVCIVCVCVCVCVCVHVCTCMIPCTENISRLH